MTVTQYGLNAGLLVFVLATSLGTRDLTWRRLVLPLALVAVAAAVFLRHVPTAGNDATLEVVGLVAGVLLGLLAGALVRVRREAGRVVTSAGRAYAALWTVVIGGRVLFAFGADHWFSQQIGLYSYTHRITGADAWTAAFVLMALAMVTTRVAVTAAQYVGATRPVVVAA
jgi:hypothetical protein